MKRLIGLIIILGVSVSLYSCGVVEGKGEAEKLAESMFQNRTNNGWNGSDQYYPALFWEKTDTAKWSNIQNLVTEAHGELQSFSLNTWRIKSGVSTNQLSGTLVTLVYENTYDQGRVSEALLLYKPLAGTKYSIIGHNFNSTQIQDLIEKGIEQAVSEKAV